MKRLILSITLALSCSTLFSQTWTLIDINPTGDSDAEGFTRLGPDAIFSANDGSNGRELWKTDGTPGGTSMIMDINPGAMGSNPENLYPFNGWVFFSATNGSDGVELWKTDGTMVGTEMVKDILIGGDGSPSGFCEAGGQLFFSAGGPGTVDKELWVSDGTTAGTQAVMNSGDPGYVEIAYDSKVEINGKCVFFMHTFAGGHEIAVSDGTSGGTEIFEVNPSGPSYPAYLTKVDDVAFFQATNSTYGGELWKTDGTSAGTVLVKDITPGISNTSMHSFQSAVFADTSNQLVFVATTPEHGAELWVSNGTETGTKILKDIIPGTIGSSPLDISAIANQLFFSALDYALGWEPHRGLQLNIQGDSAHMEGPVFQDVQIGYESSWPKNFTAFPAVVPGQTSQANVAFTAEPQIGDRQVFVYDQPFTFTDLDLSPGDSANQANNAAVLIAPPSATITNPSPTTHPWLFDTRLVLVCRYDGFGNEIWMYLPAFLTGEDDQPISSYFSISPNPSTGSLRIEIPDNERSDYEIVLTDLSGRTVHSIKSGTLSGKLIVNEELPSHLSNGTYLVKLKTENLIQGRKLILNR